MRPWRLKPDADGFDAAGALDEGAEAGQRVFREALGAAEQGLMQAAKSAERLFREGADALRAQSRTYAGPASRTVDDARRYVVTRVKARPVTATLAGLGVGFLLGVLLSSRGK